MDKDFLSDLLKGMKEKTPEALLARCRYQECLITGLLKFLVTRGVMTKVDAQSLIKEAKKG